MNTQYLKRTVTLILVAVTISFGAWHFWKQWDENQKNGYLIHGNGRIEAVEVDIATKLPGRIEKVLVDEGDFVQKGQLLAIMQTDTLNAQLAEAEAQYKQAQNAVQSAKAQVAVRKSDVAAANARVVQREAELDAAKRRLARSEVLSKENASSLQELDDNRAQMRSAKAAVIAAQAQVTAAQAAVTAAQAQVTGAKSQVTAVQATITRIRADIQDSQLTSPKDGRIQYRIAQPGEVLGAGGKVLNLVDLSDVYMTFFVPETAAGKLAIGQEVHLVLDAAPDFVIPAHISFVDSVAQFTPKTVETAKERQKLMFRVKAQIPAELLKKHIDKVKTGLPGLAWIKMDPNKDWPEHLRVTLPD